MGYPESDQELSLTRNNDLSTSPKSLFERIFSIFMGANDPAREKKKLLRDIGKTLRKNRQKFYNPKQESALPELAHFMFDFYKLLGPAQPLMDRVESSKVLKSIIVETALNEQQKKLLAGLDEDSISERAMATPPKELSLKLKDELSDFFSAFTLEKANAINATHNNMALFVDLIHFDYYFFLKKFDSAVTENSYHYKPNFEAINAEYVCDELKDFYDLILGIDKDTDWNQIFDVLKWYRDLEVISRAAWKKALKKLTDLKRSRVFELMIKHISKDPYYRPNPVIKKEKIVDQYLSALKTQVEMTLQKIVNERRNKKIEDLATAVFGTVSVSRLKNYTEKGNLLYKKNMMAGFVYVQALNYIKAFLLDFFKKDVRELMDIILVKGKWASSVFSQKLSDAYHQVIEISDNLLAFDESLNEEEELGKKLRNMFHRLDREKKLAAHARKLLMTINEQAKSIIVETGQNLILLGKSLKGALDDYSKKPHTLIVNWKELDNLSDNKVKEIMIAVYKKIYYFIQLLQFFSK